MLDDKYFILHSIMLYNTKKKRLLCSLGFTCLIPRGNKPELIWIVKGEVPGLNQLSTTPWKRIAEWRYNSTILDLGNRWKCVVSLIPRPVYSRYPLRRRPGAPQSRSGHWRVEQNIFPLPKIKPRPSSPLPVAIQTQPSRLHYRNN
jgi:hypothetical protein